LIPLRFEFANEFRPASPATDRPPWRRTRLSIRRTAARRPPHFSREE
jgi:hypothetical protein